MNRAGDAGDQKGPLPRERKRAFLLRDFCAVPGRQRLAKGSASRSSENPMAVAPPAIALSGLSRSGTTRGSCRASHTVDTSAPTARNQRNGADTGELVVSWRKRILWSARTCAAGPRNAGASPMPYSTAARPRPCSRWRKRSKPISSASRAGSRRESKPRGCPSSPHKKIRAAVSGRAHPRTILPCNEFSRGDKPCGRSSRSTHNHGSRPCS